jgi:hypothetical protein
MINGGTVLINIMTAYCSMNCLEFMVFQVEQK